MLFETAKRSRTRAGASTAERTPKGCPRPLTAGADGRPGRMSTSLAALLHRGEADGDDADGAHHADRADAGNRVPEAPDAARAARGLLDVDHRVAVELGVEAVAHLHARPRVRERHDDGADLEAADLGRADGSFHHDLRIDGRHVLEVDEALD